MPCIKNFPKTELWKNLTLMENVIEQEFPFVRQIIYALSHNSDTRSKRIDRQRQEKFAKLYYSLGHVSYE